MMDSRTKVIYTMTQKSIFEILGKVSSSSTGLFLSTV
jgi:hypothetical protein